MQIKDKYNNIPKQCKQAIYAHINAMKYSLIMKGRLGSFYKYVNSKTSTRSGVAPLKDEFGNFVINDRDLPKAECLNKYFSCLC